MKIAVMIQRFFQRPFHLLVSKPTGWLYVALAAFAIAFLLNIELPFGLNGWHHPHKTLYLSGFGLVFLGSYGLVWFILSRLFPYYSCPDKWTLGKELSMALILFVSTGFFNWLFDTLALERNAPTFQSFFNMQYCTFGFGVLPALTLMLTSNIRGMIHRKKTNPAPALLTETELKQTVAPDFVFIGGDRYMLDEVLYVKSEQNYVNLCFYRCGKLEKRTYRFTIKYIESVFENNPTVIRCHKSCVVNTDQIDRIRRNSSGADLTMKYSGEKIHVSRHYIIALRAFKRF